MTNQDVIQLTDENILGTYKRFAVALESGENATLKDFDGKTYLDFASGIGVCSLGCGNESWLAAITAQAKKLPHVSNLFYTEPAAQTAKTLVERTGMQVQIQDEDGKEVTFEVIDATEVNGTRYLAVIPYQEDPESLQEDAELILMRIGTDDEGEYMDIVDDDEELITVGKVFEERLRAMYDIDDSELQ